VNKRSNKHGKKGNRPSRPSSVCGPKDSQTPRAVPESQDEPLSAKSASPHRITIVLSLAALLVSLSSAVNSCYQTSLTRRIQKTRLIPGLHCTVRYASSTVDTNSPSGVELVVWNSGPIDAASVSVTYNVYPIDLKTLTPYGVFGIKEELDIPPILLPKVGVGQKVGKQILGISAVAVYRVRSVFFRETDMEKFIQEDLFFCDSGVFYTHEGFKQRKEYGQIMASLQKSLGFVP
jgi:hypothetical protein